MYRTNLLTIIEHLKKALLSTAGLFVLIGLPAAVIFILIVPPAWGLDEQVHIPRAYQISQGNLYPDPIGDGEFGGSIPRSLSENIDYGHQQSNDTKRESLYYVRKDIVDKRRLNELNNAKIKSSEQVVSNFGPTGPNVPIVYAPAATGMYIGRQANLSVFGTVQLAKLFQALIYLGIGCLILILLRNSKARWLFFIAMLLPSQIYQATTINADPYTTATVLLFSALMLMFISRAKNIKINNLELLAMGLATVLLMFAKPIYNLLALAVLLLPLKTLHNKSRKYWAIGVLTLTSATVFLASFVKALPYYTHSSSLYKDTATASLIDPFGQAKWALLNPIDFSLVLWHSLVSLDLEWLQSFVGNLGYNTVPTPFFLVLLTCFSIALAAFYAKDLITKKQAALLLFLGTSVSVLIILAMYATFNTIGNERVRGVQGRYFVPCLMFVALGAARLIPLKVEITPRHAKLTFVAISTLVLYTTVYLYQRSLF